MALKMTFICPYCFEKHRLTDVQFRCTNTRCKDFDDIEMTKYENGDPRMPKKGKRTFPSGGQNPFGVPKVAFCPECGRDSHTVICPSCHNELPESTLLGEDMIISIVGSRNTGKSHFVGVIINELRNRIAPRFDGNLESFADSNKLWQEKFGNQLYDKKNPKKLPLTKSSLTDVDNGAYRPLIFKLRLPHNGLIKSKKKEPFTFVFFDTAGEDLDDANTMNTVNKYICKSAGIIFLLDPMQIPAVAQQLDDSVVERASGRRPELATQPDDIMTRVSDMIRKDRGISEQNTIDIPVAVVFSKFDAIESIVPRDCVVHSPSPHCGQKSFVKSDWHNVDSEIKALLQEWEATAFVSQLENNYSKYSYFAVSTLGLDNNPTLDGRIEIPRPHRIEDPLLWILHEKKLIKGQ